MCGQVSSPLDGLIRATGIAKTPSSEKNEATDVCGRMMYGWMHFLSVCLRLSVVVRTRGHYEVRLYAYSEHSNFQELITFVDTLKPTQVVRGTLERWMRGCSLRATYHR